MALLRATWPEHTSTQTYLGILLGALHRCLSFRIVGRVKVFFLMGTCESTSTDVSKPKPERKDVSHVTLVFYLLFFDLLD